MPTTTSQDPEPMSFCQRFGQCLWNAENRTTCGRTPESWGKLGAYYFVYYTSLVLFVALVFSVFWVTVPDDKPRCHARYGQKRRDAVLLDPGMGMVPRDVTLMEVPMLEFSQSSASSYSGYVAEIGNFIQAYDNVNGNITVRDSDCATANVTECGVVDETQRGPCTAGSSYGYGSGTPCIMLKLNKIIGLKPAAYGTTPSLLSTLVDTAHGSSTMHSTLVSAGSDNIIITCQEENPKKIRSPPSGFLTSVDFYPDTGLPFDCFPFCGKKLQTGEDAYLQPYVAARFTVTANEAVSIWCRAWYGDVVHHHNDKIGSIRFKLRVNA